MDHRLGRRRRMRTLVEVRSRRGLRARGLLCNISRDGMFLLCEPAPELNDSIDVYMGSAPKQVRIPGMVIHRRTNGVGVMFRDLEPSARSMIEKCLR